MLPVLARARLESWLGEEEDAAVRFDAGGATGAGLGGGAGLLTTGAFVGAGGGFGLKILS